MKNNSGYFVNIANFKKIILLNYKNNDVFSSFFITGFFYTADNVF